MVKVVVRIRVSIIRLNRLGSDGISIKVRLSIRVRMGFMVVVRVSVRVRFRKTVMLGLG